MFLKHKEDARVSKNSYPKVTPGILSFSAFRNFLFDFLDLPEAERKSLESWNTEQLAKALQDSGRMSQARYAILLAQFSGLKYLAEIEPAKILLDTLPLKFF